MTARLTRAPPKNQPRSNRRLTIQRAGIPDTREPAEPVTRTGSLRATPYYIHIHYIRRRG